MHVKYESNDPVSSLSSPFIQWRVFVLVDLCSPGLKMPSAFHGAEIPSVLLEDAERPSRLGILGLPAVVPFQVAKQISRPSTAGRVEPRRPCVLQDRRCRVLFSARSIVLPGGVEPQSNRALTPVNHAKKQLPFSQMVGSFPTTLGKGGEVVSARLTRVRLTAGRVAGGQLNTYFIALGGVELRVLRNHLYQRFLLTLKKISTSLMVIQRAAESNWSPTPVNIRKKESVIFDDLASNVYEVRSERSPHLPGGFELDSFRARNAVNPRKYEPAEDLVYFKVEGT
jgi:hypothetical protein